MDLTWALAVVSFLSGGAGAYLGSYLKKKGEHLATRDDIDELVDQLRTVTTTTKEIEASISNDVWDRQKRWEMKRDVLYEAARASTGLDRALTEVSRWRRDSEDQSEHLSQAKQDYKEALGKLESAEVAVDLVCKLRSSIALKEFVAVVESLYGALIVGDSEGYDNFRLAVVDKLRRLVEASREELEDKPV